MELGRTAPATTAQSRRIMAALSAAALALSVGACSSGDDPAAVPSAAGVQVAPIFEMIGFAGPEYQAFEASLINSYEQGLAECLADAGFEHTPQPPRQVNLVTSKDEYLERANTSGYGIITQSEGLAFPEDDPQERFPYYAIDADTSAAHQTAHEDAVEANTTYQDSLSDEEYEAYQLARYGEFSEDDFTVDEEGNIVPVEPDGDSATTASCEEQVSSYLTDPAAEILDGEDFEEINDLLADFYETLDSTDAIAATYQPWSACIAEATGEDIERPSDVIARITEEFEALLEEAGVFDDEDDEDALNDYLLEQEENDYEIDLTDELDEDVDEESWSEELELSDEDIEFDLLEEGEDFLDEDEEFLDDIEFDEEYAEYEDDETVDLDLFDDEEGEEFDAASYAEELGLEPAALVALLERETTLAAADVECRFSTGHFDSIRAAQIDLEEQFIAQHEAELERLATAIREARSAL